jgi:alcohol dehydrogenase (nicotinoprotein)
VKILGLWRAGDIKLNELVSRRYTLDQINEGYHDLVDGKNIRGVLIHEH